MATVLTLHDYSDRETAEAVKFDVRWRVAIGVGLDDPDDSDRDDAGGGQLTWYADSAYGARTCALRSPPPGTRR
jgi:hypothetical protein